MELETVAFYFFADDLLKANCLCNDPLAKMTHAEIITAILTAAQFFHGNQRSATVFLKEYGYISCCLSESHFNQRLHRIPVAICQKLLSVLRDTRTPGRHNTSCTWLSGSSHRELKGISELSKIST